MKTTQITPAVIQLTRFNFVNAYLVREDDGFTLVDTTVGVRPTTAMDTVTARAA